MCNKQMIIRKEIQNTIDTQQKVLQNSALVGTLELMAEQVVECLKNGGKLLICGNGGSASDALHIAGEIVGRFQKERRAYPAIALNSDVATMTAISNDYGFEQVFARQIEGLMTEKDILLALSASGNSRNVIEAVKKAHEIGGRAYLLSGKDGGELKNICDLSIIAPSNVTAHIQESHMCLYHILCGLIENEMLDE